MNQLITPVLQPRTDMLFALSEHLLNGKLGHEKFNFYFYNSFQRESFLGSQPLEKCGTYGCALGELPILYKALFHFRGNRILDNSGEEVQKKLDVTFNISKEEAKRLYDIFHDFSVYNDVCQDKIITKEMVAHKLFEFATELESKYLIG